MASHKVPPLVCSIGSTDPTAAAGIGLDLRVFARLGVRAAFAVAAVTAQNARRVSAIELIDPDVVVAQLRAIWETSRPDAVRIGLLPSADAIRAVAGFFRDSSARPPVVVDPVLAATSGTPFLKPRDVTALWRLFAIATLITPNASEAQALSGIRVATLAGARQAAIALSTFGCAALVTGGHLPGSLSVDVLAIDGAIAFEFRAPRLRRVLRGTGCSLAAAIAVGLARGQTLTRAISQAKTFARGELRRGEKENSRRAATAANGEPARR